MSTVALWVRGLLRRRPAEVAGAVVAVALAVGFLGALGSFITVNRGHLTDRATASVGVDWQVQVTAGSDPARVAAAVRNLPNERAAASVAYASVPGLSATKAGSTRTTGQADVVSLQAGYLTDFPSEFRPLVGNLTGPTLLQQTASNLAAGPGDTVTVQGLGGHGGVPVRITGVADMPQADSFFQTVGAPAGVGPSAPPDNVLLVPDAMFAKLVVGAPIVRQVHVSFDHGWLSQDPAAAAGQIDASRNHLETQLTGAALVGDNLGAALSAAREDALYGQLLFLLLGIPAFLVALSVTALVITVRGERRVRELSLLRIRGASGGILAAVVGGEAAVVLAGGILLGWPAAMLAGHWAFGSGHVARGWFAAGAGMLTVVVGGLLAASALRSLRRDADALQGVRTVEVPLTGQPWPLRIYADFALLAGAAVVFWLVAHGGYQVVVVPEGVPTTSVNWGALLAPALAWPGLALLVWRLVDLASGRLRISGDKNGGELIRAAVRRRRRTVARGATVLAVAVGVAGSTAVFTATYREQSRLDVALTVGADVSAVLPNDPTQASQLAAKARQAPDVRASSVQIHRYAYVGNDLQDFYGIDPTTIAAATPLRDVFVPGGTISSDLQQLQAHPDGVLLSAETLHDYQLRPGDKLQLRLQAGPSQQYKAIPFTVLGQVSEWPTAPKDSFIVANDSYTRQMTGQPGAPTLLLSSSSPLRTANALRAQFPTAAHVNDITTARSSVTTASGLAATDLGGLARLQLGFGVLFAVSGFGLALLIGVLQRRRAVVLLAALGATARQRGRFLAAEARAVLVGGLVGGVAIAAAIAVMLVRVMTGIFDPPPDHAIVPWGYLIVLGVAVALTAVFVVAIVGGWAGRAGPRELRDL